MTSKHRNSAGVMREAASNSLDNDICYDYIWRATGNLLSANHASCMLNHQNTNLIPGKTKLFVIARLDFLPSSMFCEARITFMYCAATCTVTD